MEIAKHVAVIGAHPLDAELLGGPLMIKYSGQGARCTCIHATQGRLEDPRATEQQRKDYLRELAKQEEKAATILGAQAMWLGMISTSLPNAQEAMSMIEKYLISEKVDLVVTHWRGSMHPRHVFIYQAVTDAVRDMLHKGMAIELLYGETFEDLNGFIPQAYIEMTIQEVNRWQEALTQYWVYQGLINDYPYKTYYPNSLQIRKIESGANGPTVAYMYASLLRNRLW